MEKDKLVPSHQYALQAMQFLQTHMLDIIHKLLTGRLYDLFNLTLICQYKSLKATSTPC